MSRRVRYGMLNRLHVPGRISIFAECRTPALRYFTDMIGLVDCNNFFVSCERVIQPELAGRPVVVLSNNDGCAVALSEEAKALGFKRGDPFFKIRTDCERNGVAVLSGNHRLYRDISSRVMMTLRALLPDDIEVYSIDEAFVGLDTSLGDLSEYGRYLVGKVLHDTGIPVSLGIARTKTLAKVAARFAKKYPGYGGVCLMETSDKEHKALSMTRVEDVWGIGRRHARRLKERGVLTALQFAELPSDVVSRMFNVGGVRTWRELHGEACVVRDPVPLERQTITSSRSFATDVRSFEELRQAICAFASMVGRKLRESDGFASEVSVFLCTNRFHRQEPQYYNAVSRRMPDATNYTPVIAEAAVDALREIYRDGYGYKRAGLTLSRITPRCGVQRSLFTDTAAEEKRMRLMKVMDNINGRSPSRDCLRIASEGDGLGRFVRRQFTDRPTKDDNGGSGHD